METGLFSKKFIGFVGVCTALVIFVCYLFFDLRIVMVVKRAMGMPKPMLTIVDEVPTQLYFDKVLPIAQRNGISIGCNVEPWHVNNWQKWSKVSLKDCLDAGLEVIPMCRTYKDSDKVIQSKAEYRKQVIAEQDFFKKVGIQTDVIVLPWRKRNRELANKVLPEFYQASILRWGRQMNSWPMKSRYEISELGPKMTYEEMSRFVDGVAYDNCWGIMMLRTWNKKSMTPESFDDLDKVIQYARQQGVEVVPLREGLKRFARD